jgi:hypothetical protein
MISGRGAAALIACRMPITSRGPTASAFRPAIRSSSETALLEEDYIAAALLDLDSGPPHHDRVALGQRIGLGDMRSFGDPHDELPCGDRDLADTHRP